MSINKGFPDIIVKHIILIPLNVDSSEMVVIILDSHVIHVSL